MAFVTYLLTYTSGARRLHVTVHCPRARGPSPVNRDPSLNEAPAPLYLYLYTSISLYTYLMLQVPGATLGPGFPDHLIA